MANRRKADVPRFRGVAVDVLRSIAAWPRPDDADPGGAVSDAIQGRGRGPIRNRG